MDFNFKILQFLDFGTTDDLGLLYIGIGIPLLVLFSKLF